MAYLRFLTDKDYISAATEEHLGQLIRDHFERFPMAEQRAEMNFLEYLDQYYEIERVLAVGKNIREYNSAVCYPGNVWLKNDGKIYKTLKAINGIKKPTKTVYWRHITEFVDPCLLDKALKYSQLRTYAKGEVVRFGTEYFMCVIPHGYESSDIHLPGVETWKEAEITPWEANLEWEINQVCSYEDKFYQYLGKKEDEDEDDDQDTAVDPTTESTPSSQADGLVQAPEILAPDPVLIVDLPPDENEEWGEIGEYSEDYEYDYSEGACDYVVADNTVFYPVMNPNPDALAEGVNITLDDPRNPNVIAHMVSISLYYLHQIISPTNISDTRVLAYENSLMWLSNASKLKINPQIPRKRDHQGEKKVDWALETYQRTYDPGQNPWLI